MSRSAEGPRPYPLPPALLSKLRLHLSWGSLDSSLSFRYCLPVVRVKSAYSFDSFLRTTTCGLSKSALGSRSPLNLGLHPGPPSTVKPLSIHVGPAQWLRCGDAVSCVFVPRDVAIALRPLPLLPGPQRKRSNPGHRAPRTGWQRLYVAAAALAKVLVYIQGIRVRPGLGPTRLYSTDARK